MLWSGLVSRAGVSHRVSLVATFPLRQNCPRKTTDNYYDVLVLQSKKSTCLGLAEINACLTVSKASHLTFGSPSLTLELYNGIPKIMHIRTYDPSLESRQKQLSQNLGLVSGHAQVGKVCTRAKWLIRPELIRVSAA